MVPRLLYWQRLALRSSVPRRRTNPYRSQFRLTGARNPSEFSDFGRALCQETHGRITRIPVPPDQLYVQKDPKAQYKIG